MTIYDDVVGTIEAVKARCEAELTPAGITTIFGYVGQGNQWPLTSSGLIKPCVVIELPGIRKSRAGAGITGQKNTMQEMHFDALCVGPTAMSALKTFGLVCSALVGFTPTPGGGEIGLLGAALRSPAMQTQVPTRYAMPVGFTLSIGAIVVI